MCHHNHHSSSTGDRTTRKERRRAVAIVNPSKPPAKDADAETSEWVVVDFDGRGFRCERCGTTEKHSTPRGVSRLDSFSLRGRAFAIDHAGCLMPNPSGATP